MNNNVTKIDKGELEEQIQKLEDTVDATHESWNIREVFDDKCSECGGTGKVELPPTSERIDYPKCNGTGVKELEITDDMTRKCECEACHGKGGYEASHRECPACYGTGVDIPKLFEDYEILENERIRWEEEYRRECGESEDLRDKLEEAMDLLGRQSPLYWAFSGDQASAQEYEKEVEDFFNRMKDHEADS